MTVIPNPPTLGDTFVNEVTGVTYEYDGEKWIVIKTPGSEEAEQIGEDLSALTSRVSAGETTQDFIETEQGVQNNQINALETQLQLLANTTGGVWKYQRNILNGSVRPPNGSRFYGTHIDDVSTVLEKWSDIRLLMVNKTDTTGTDFLFTGFEVGDKIEIIATDASSLCIGTIETAATQENYGNMVISPDRTKGGPEEDKEYLISVYRPGEQGSGLDLDVLDERYVQNSGDNVVNAPWRIKSDSKTFINVAGDDLKLYHVADPTGNDDAWAANKGYVDTQVSTVDTKIDTEISAIDLRVDDKIDTAVEPLSTKEYVDAAVADAVSSLDLTNYVRKSEFKHFNRAPAVLSWKWNSTSSGDSKPTDETFKITKNGDDTYIRFSFYTSNGVHLGDSPYSDTNVSIDNGPVGTIWYWHYQAEDWRLKEQFRINSFRWNYKDHFEMRMTSRHGNKSYTVGTSYYITVGGFF